MTVSLGLDIGTNSVGSAWIDTEKKEITLGVSVFPAGVEQSDTKRGAPKNQARRSKRSQRRSIRRRSQRKARLRKLLSANGLLPSDKDQLRSIFGPRREGKVFDLTKWNPWNLRREGLHRELSPDEFGRVLVHLNQRRGALGVTTDLEETDEGKVKDAIDRTTQLMTERKVSTFGHLMADLLDERREQHQPIRNRENISDSEFLHADRKLIRKEFDILWSKQKSLNSELAKLLTDEFRTALDDATEDNTWRHKGELFGQRRTYWDTGTLGRCNLEPSDQLCPLADMYAQEYRVIESVNNMRIKARDESEWRPLSVTEREKVIGYLRGQGFTPLSRKDSKRQPKPKKSVKDPKSKHIREVLGIDSKTLAKEGIPENQFQLNLENDPDRKINTDWFYSNIVLGAFGKKMWDDNPQIHDSVNRAVLKFDPELQEHREKLFLGASNWWGLNREQVNLFIKAWSNRPSIKKSMKLSRRAIRNLLPYMNTFDDDNNRWPTQIEARMHFAKDKSKNLSDLVRQRYSLESSPLNKASRHYLRKHPDQLPPAPMISNPVVRKAIHEVRRHLNAYLRKFKRRPDRVVIEFVRGVKDSAKQRNKQLSQNRKREEKRRRIEADLKKWRVPESNWRMAILRVRLCEEQNGICPYSLDGPNSKKIITPRNAATGNDVEIEHIIPESITGKTLDFNNVVLCFRGANRKKGNRTPLDWLGPNGLAEVLRRMEKTNVKNNFTKWERLQTETPDPETYRNSQLTDTAYASRQVSDYVNSALYSLKSNGKRYVFTTKGSYTARLRADWGLHESEIDRQHGIEPPIDETALRDDPELAQALRRARKDPTKDRIDHRHHALDALVIALTPDYIVKIGEAAAKDREYYEKVGRHPRRTCVKPAWGTVEEFRQTCLASLNELLVSHRPEKRRIVGALHKETAYGIAEEYPGLYTERMSATKLKSSQMVEPILETESGNWKIPGRGQGRAIRDSNLRREIEICLQQNGIDPTSFTDADIKQLTNSEDWKLRTLGDIPIKSLTMLLAMSDPVTIVGKDGVARFFMARNNHHMEVFEDVDTLEWKGKTITTFVAASRNAERLRELKNAGVPPVNEFRRLKKHERQKYHPIISDICQQFPIVDRSDNESRRFIMSLAIGETFFLRHKSTGEPGYFVVYKMDDTNAFFHPHWDARHASGKNVKNPRDEFSLSAGQMKELVVDPDNLKIDVTPLGEIRPRLKD